MNKVTTSMILEHEPLAQELPEDAIRSTLTVLRRCAKRPDPWAALVAGCLARSFGSAPCLRLVFRGILRLAGHEVGPITKGAAFGPPSAPPWRTRLPGAVADEDAA